LFRKEVRGRRKNKRRGFMSKGSNFKKRRGG